MYIANNDYTLSSGKVKKGSEMKIEATMEHGNGNTEVIFKVGRRLFVVSEQKFESMHD